MSIRAAKSAIKSQKLTFLGQFVHDLVLLPLQFRMLGELIHHMHAIHLRSDLLQLLPKSGLMLVVAAVEQADLCGRWSVLVG